MLALLPAIGRARGGAMAEGDAQRGAISWAPQRLRPSTPATISSRATPAAPPWLRWDRRKNQLDAAIDRAPLKKVLGRLAFLTGWKIYIEPGADPVVTAKFRDRSVPEALEFILGKLNFLLIPDSAAGRTRLLIYRTSADQAVQLVENARQNGQIIPNELVVVLDANSKQSIGEIARKLGARVAGEIDSLHAYRLQFKDDAAAQAGREALANLPGASVQANYALDWPEAGQQPGAGLAAAFSLRAKPVQPGSAPVIALVDTPLQPLPGKLGDFLLPAIHVAGQPLADQPELTHGTSMAETILNGLAAVPQAAASGISARILPVDIYGSSDTTTTFDLARGIVSAVDNGATIVNLSLGSDSNSPLLGDLIHQARQNGVLFFGAAGNEPTTTPTYPAAYPDVIAVTASDQRGQVAPYANRGDFVQVIAPGDSLVPYDGLNYIVTGTSAATAFVSGAAGGLQSLGKSPQDTVNLIRMQMSFRPKP